MTRAVMPWPQSKIHTPGKPVAFSLGQLYRNHGLLRGMVADDFELPGFPGS